jgi:hypothetical protein
MVLIAEIMNAYYTIIETVCGILFKYDRVCLKADGQNRMDAIELRYMMAVRPHTITPAPGTAMPRNTLPRIGEPDKMWPVPGERVYLRQGTRVRKAMSHD